MELKKGMVEISEKEMLNTTGGNPFLIGLGIVAGVSFIGGVIDGFDDARDNDNSCKAPN